MKGTKQCMESIHYIIDNTSYTKDQVYGMPKQEFEDIYNKTV